MHLAAETEVTIRLVGATCFEPTTPQLLKFIYVASLLPLSCIMLTRLHTHEPGYFYIIVLGCLHSTLAYMHMRHDIVLYAMLCTTVHCNDVTAYTIPLHEKHTC